MLVTSLILVIAGVALFAYGLNMRRRWIVSFRRMRKALGQVVDVEDDPSELPGAVLLTVRYLTVRGEECEFQTREIRNKGVNIGDSVEVFYTLAHPDQATLGAPEPRSSLLAVSFMMGGIVCLFIGIFLFAATLRVA